MLCFFFEEEPVFFTELFFEEDVFFTAVLLDVFFFDELTDAFLEELFFDEAIFLDEREDDFLALYLELP